jgi:hypothetical protein
LESSLQAIFICTGAGEMRRVRTNQYSIKAMVYPIGVPRVYVQSQLVYVERDDGYWECKKEKHPHHKYGKRHGKRHEDHDD